MPRVSEIYRMNLTETVSVNVVGVKMDRTCVRNIVILKV